VLVQSVGIDAETGLFLRKTSGKNFHLIRVLRNLVENTLKYSGETLHNIKIGYSEDSKSHVLTFSDDGPGIEKKDLEKIFDRFQRNDAPTGISGSGLGLTISKVLTVTD